MELWDVLDEKGVKTGRTMVRGEPPREGEYHLLVHVWIRNTDGRYLISRRTAFKDAYPGLWECTGGSAVSGDSSGTTALKEVREEVGIELDSSAGRIIHRYRGRNQYSSFFCDVWLFEHKIDLAEVRCQEEEVDEARLAAQDEIRRLIGEGSFVPEVASYIDLVFGARHA